MGFGAQRGRGFSSRGGRGGSRGGFGGRGGSKFGGRGGGRGGFGGRSGGGGRGRGGARGGRGRAGSTTVVTPHRFNGVFIAKGKEDMLVTRNLTPGKSVYGETKVEVEENGTKVEYRAWNPFRSKLAASILGGIRKLHMKPGCSVLYLGAASGTTVSHVSDLVGADGQVFAVEFSPRCGRDLLNVAKERPNIVPIIEDARHPWKYQMCCGMVDVVFADIAQPDQARIVGENAKRFLKTGGHYIISIKATCIDSTAKPEAVFAQEVAKLKEFKLRPEEQMTLEPYERDHAVVIGTYRKQKKQE